MRVNTQRGNSLRGKDADRSKRKPRGKVLIYVGLPVLFYSVKRHLGVIFTVSESIHNVKTLLYKKAFICFASSNVLLNK